MRADFKIVLDACVLANFSVCDLYLRLAERPRLYLPRWSTQILDETEGVLKVGMARIPRSQLAQ